MTSAGRERSGLRQALTGRHPRLSGGLIAYSRLALAGIALIATYLDPTQPARFSGVAYFLLIVYVAYSAVIAATVSLRPGGLPGALARHMLDIAVFACLTYLTRGPTSPFFVFFTFAILSGALRWGRNGALATAAVLLAWYVGISAYEFGRGDDPDLNRVIVRAGYLFVAAVFIGYFGEYRDRSQRVLERLANWPRATNAAADKPALEAILGHTALVLDIERIVVVWNVQHVSGWQYADWKAGECSFGSWQVDGNPSPILNQPPADRLLLLGPAKQGLIAAAGESAGDPVIASEFAERFHIGQSACIPLETASMHGYLLIPDPALVSPELVALTTIVAARIEGEFEHFRLMSELSQTAVAAERARLARDLHDSLLQDLTATALQLKARATSEPDGSRQIHEEVIRMLSSAQQRIRHFVSVINPKDETGGTVAVRATLDPVVNALADQWDCNVSLRLMPSDAEAPGTEISEIVLILSEAVANAVRHGHADAIEIDLDLRDSLEIVVRDNGRGNAQADGGITSVRPFSLAQRVEGRGGHCTLTLGTRGATLAVQLARR